MHHEAIHPALNHQGPKDGDCTHHGQRKTVDQEIIGFGFKQLTTEKKDH